MIAKLDRLSRDAHFLLGLEKAGVDFVAADMPHANRLTVSIMELVAEEERRMISARTKAALVAAKARGTVLGGYRGHTHGSCWGGRQALPGGGGRYTAGRLGACAGRAARDRNHHSWWHRGGTQRSRDPGGSGRGLDSDPSAARAVVGWIAQKRRASLARDRLA
ncbi:recombinase family protein [Methylobacterium sp. WL64]|uniref:recombinase family protein n=1 Tax=Methylobacterium sp. WL64 TaxID=2603894 RepID=UPI0027BA5DC9|nr:recombinase family protein [Methylobacterium sp. WL64]